MRSWNSRRRPDCPSSPPPNGTRPPRPRSAQASSSWPPSRRASATSWWASAGARRPTAGPGALRALGAAVSEGLDRVDLAGLDPRLAEVTLRIACDVTNPLLGARGAAATYGPQKGATPADVAALDARLALFADALDGATGRHERDSPGAGAAGGIGFGLLCLRDRFRSLSLEPGIDLVMAATGFDAKLAEADLVITGEGRIDAQTAFGKTALGVARRAQGGRRPMHRGRRRRRTRRDRGAGAARRRGRPRPRTTDPGRRGDRPRRRPARRLRRTARVPRAQDRDPSGLRRPAVRPPTSRNRRPSPGRRRRRVRGAARAASRTRAGPGRRGSSGGGRASSRSCWRRLAERYGRPVWERRLDPTSELILTILTQNSADINAERAFESLRAAFPSGGVVQVHAPGPGWGGGGLSPGAAPDWAAVETAPLPELIEAIRPGGLAVSKSPRIQNALRLIREERGDHSLEFLADMAPLEARDWLTRIDGIGKKTASVLLLFCFGMPLMPVDRHVERVEPADRPHPAEGDGRRRARPLPGPPRAGTGARSAREPHPARPGHLPRPPAGLRPLPGRAALPLPRPARSLSGPSRCDNVVRLAWTALPILGSC